MAARKARKFVAMTDMSEFGGSYFITEEDEYIDPFDLTNVECMQVLAAFGINHRDYPTLDQKRDAIWDKRYDHADFPGTVKEEVTQGNVTVDLSGLSDALAKVSDALTVSDDKIRQLVKEEAEKYAPPVIRVQVREMPEVTITSRQHEVFPTVVKLAAMRKHVWLHGPKGSGKTTLAQKVADALGLAFYSTPCHGQMTEAKVLGMVSPIDHQYKPSAFRVAWEHGGVHLHDEIDSANAVLVAVNQALANGECAFPDSPHPIPKHADFVEIGGANTIGMGASAEYNARQKQDGALLDRFVMVEMSYDTALERELVMRWASDDNASTFTSHDAEEWVRQYNAWRRKAEETGVNAGLGTRGLVEGAELLAHGFTRAEVLSMRVVRGVSADQWRKVEGSC